MLRPGALCANSGPRFDPVGGHCPARSAGQVVWTGTVEKYPLVGRVKRTAPDCNGGHSIPNLLSFGL